MAQDLDRHLSLSPNAGYVDWVIHHFDMVEKDVQEEAERLAAPQHCSILPVLIHANQVSEGVQYGDVFARIIDFSDVLREGTR